MDNFVIVTATQYKEADPRLPLALLTLVAARRCYYPVVVVDDSSDPCVREMLIDKGAYVFRQKEAGFGNAVRQAISKGLEIVGQNGIIVWQEPEKIDMVWYYDTLALPIYNGMADMVIPRRTQASLSTYPIEQVHSEKLLNRYAWLLSGKTLDVDLGSGVRIFRSALGHFFTTYGGGLWDSLVIPVIRAARAGNEIESVDTDYCHPPQQKEIEEGSVFWCEKRITQLQYLVPVLQEEWKKKS